MLLVISLINSQLSVSDNISTTSPCIGSLTATTFGQSFGRLDIGMMVLFIMLTGHRWFRPHSPYIYHLHTGTVSTSTFPPPATTIFHSDTEEGSSSYVEMLLRPGETRGPRVAGPITAASTKRRTYYNETTSTCVREEEMDIRYTQGGSIELGEHDIRATTSSSQPIHLPRATFTDYMSPNICLAVERTSSLNTSGLAGHLRIAVS